MAEPTDSTGPLAALRDERARDENDRDENARDERPAAAAVARRRRTVLLLAVVGLLLALVGSLLGWYLTTGKPVSRLPGLAQDRMPHYLFSIYGSTQPLAVAVSPDGARVYVTESGGERLVRVYDRDGSPHGTLRPPDDQGPGGHVPMYVAVDPVTEQVYVSDRQQAAVYVYDADGDYLRTLSPDPQVGEWAPLGLAFDRQGRLYVTDVRAAGDHRLLVLDPDGGLVRAVTPPGGLDFPNGVVVDDHGDIELCDSNNSRVLVLGPDGSVLGRIVGGAGDSALGLPRGVAAADGRLYVVDAVNHGVRMYRMPSSADSVPGYLASFGVEGTVDGAFEYPNGVAADSRARVYVTDRENDRVQVWTY